MANSQNIPHLETILGRAVPSYLRHCCTLLRVVCDCGNEIQPTRLVRHDDCNRCNDEYWPLRDYNSGLTFTRRDGSTTVPCLASEAMEDAPTATLNHSCERCRASYQQPKKRRSTTLRKRIPRAEQTPEQRAAALRGVEERKGPLLASRAHDKTSPSYHPGYQSTKTSELINDLHSFRHAWDLEFQQVKVTKIPRGEQTSAERAAAFEQLNTLKIELANNSFRDKLSPSYRKYYRSPATRDKINEIKSLRIRWDLPPSDYATDRELGLSAGTTSRRWRQGYRLQPSAPSQIRDRAEPENDRPNKKTKLSSAASASASTIPPQQQAIDINIAMPSSDTGRNNYLPPDRSNTSSSFGIPTSDPQFPPDSDSGFDTDLDRMEREVEDRYNRGYIYPSPPGLDTYPEIVPGYQPAGEYNPDVTTDSGSMDWD